MKFQANFLYKPGNFQMDDCQIDKVAELSHEDFCHLKITPLEDQPFIVKNKSCMYSEDGIMHCLLALGQGSYDGMLIESEGYNYRRLKEDNQSGLRLKELLPLLKESGLMFLCHEEAERSVLVENLRLLTDTGQEAHAALLNARVSEICETPEGTEIMLTDVEPEELVRFNEAYDAFTAAERSMGPAMG